VAWIWSIVLLTSLLTVVALARTGSQVFWRAEPWPLNTPTPAPPRPMQVAAATLLLGYGVAMTVFGGPVMRYTQAAAEQLLSPGAYIDAAHATTPRLREPSP
jgi:multicomponent K+:H+ antiporter subunit D